MRRSSLLFTAWLSVLTSSAHSQGARVEDIPVDSWVYETLTELSTAGLLSDLPLHTRPFSRGRVVAAVAELLADRPNLSTGSQFLITRLESEFAEELVANDPIRSDHRARLGGGPTARIDQLEHGYSKNRVGFDAIGSFTVADAVAARARVRFDSDGRHDTQFHGEYWKENFTAWVEQAVIVARWKRLHIAFGREYWRWGFSPHDAMLVSDHSPPFDGLRVSYEPRRWSYSFHAAMLDEMYVTSQDYANGEGPEGVANRYLVAHRLAWRPRSNLEIAASEVMVFGGFNRRWEWNYLNPILPYYWEQLNDDTNDNPLWNLELSWGMLQGLKVYGEWMIDDFQIDFESEPQQIGLLGGIYWIPSQFEGRLALNGEYQRINTFVYGQGQPWNRYFHHSDRNNEVIGIGSILGTDADRVTVSAICHVSSHVDLTGRIDHVRRGENRINDPQESGVPKGEPFPSSVVEHDLRVGLGARFQRGGQIVASGIAGYNRVQDRGHVPHNDSEGPFVQLRLNVLFWKTFGV